MKLSISNIAWTAEQDVDIYRKMSELGFSGLEIAPTRIFPEQPYTHIKEARRWIERLRHQYGFVIPSMQSIWYGREERIFGTQEERTRLLKYTKRAIEFASAIGCKNLVFGCPKNRVLPDDADVEIASSFFRELGEYASSHGTVIGLEANPPVYHTNFINTTQEAFQLIEIVASDGFRLNLDVGTMLYNRESVAELTGKVQYLSHVHISEPNLCPVVPCALHQELADCLHDEKYDGFISIEMSRVSNINVIFETMAYVAEQFV